MNGQIIRTFFDTRYPLDFAYAWDNVGLQIGTLDKTLTGILITLDVTQDVAKEALQKGANLIISHHPLIFKPLANIVTDSYKGQLIEQLLKSGITVYVSHTNYDLGHTGMNQVLADRLALTEQAVLDPIDDTHGLGRIGRLREPLGLNAAIAYIKQALSLRHARFIGVMDDDTRIQTLAISGGSGASQMHHVKASGADLYLTGDVSYHQAHDMRQLGLRTLDIGHYAEHLFAPALKKELEDYGVNVPIYASNINLDPFTFV